MNKVEPLEPKQIKALNQFRNSVGDILKPEHDDEYLLRWLRARDFDVSKAEKMIRKSFKFMHNIDAEDILHSDYQPPQIMRTYVPTYFLGFDDEGSPVRAFLPGLLEWGGYYRSLSIVDIMKFVKYIVDSDLQLARVNAKKTGKLNPQTVLIFDYDQFNMRQILDKTIISKSIILLQMYQDNYPELLKVVYIINIPPTFRAALNMVKPFIHEKTFRKFRVTTRDECWTNELFQHVDPKIIPKHYGGNLEHSACDPQTFLKISNDGKIPKEYYLKNDLHLKATDTGMQTIFLQERSIYHHRVDVQKPDTIIKWEFQTKDYNIRFGVFFKTSLENTRNKSLCEAVVKVETVESHIVPERGELLCLETGEYSLCFDNTYSWLMKKQLLLKVDVKEP